MHLKYCNSYWVLAWAKRIRLVVIQTKIPIYMRPMDIGYSAPSVYSYCTMCLCMYAP